MGVAALDAPMHQAMALAWDSFRAGSLGIGAVVTCDDEVIATGRNRLAESDPGDDVLAGSSVAHAEINALAKLPWRRHRDDHLTVWTTLQPCLQCAGAIRLGRVDAVQVLAPDPLFRGVDRARDLNEHLARGWPSYVEREIDGWAALSLLFQTHYNIFWEAEIPRWKVALPTITALGFDLAETGELIALAASDADVDDVAATMWDRLTPCTADVRAVATAEP